ncbi:MAG TPA: hypothetical protein VIX86_03390 [Streptosporangiaceae bacterium]
MTTLLNLILPDVQPMPFLGVVGLCFAWSAAATVAATLLVRFTFRRGKGLEDL